MIMYKPLYIAFVDSDKAFPKLIDIDFKNREIIHRLCLIEKVVLISNGNNVLTEAKNEKEIKRECNVPSMFVCFMCI